MTTFGGRSPHQSDTKTVAGQWIRWRFAPRSVAVLLIVFTASLPMAIIGVSLALRDPHGWGWDVADDLGISGLALWVVAGILVGLTERRAWYERTQQQEG